MYIQSPDKQLNSSSPHKKVILSIKLYPKFSIFFFSKSIFFFISNNNVTPDNKSPIFYILNNTVSSELNVVDSLYTSK